MTQTEFPKPPRRINNVFIRRLGLTLTVLGMFIFTLGAVPGWYGLDNSEAVGFVQVVVFSAGLLMICLGGSYTLGSLWPRHWRSIPADLGLRLTWSGWVFAVVSAMADVLGLGTRPLSVSFTFFGFWQARGVMIGEAVMFIGFVMMIPFHKEFPPEPGEHSEEETNQAIQSAAEEQPEKKVSIVIEND
jgi:hypothetical protein